MQISIEVQGASKVGVFLDAFPRETGTAILRALKRGTDAAATRAGRVISQDMGLKVGDVRKRIKVTDPNGTTLEGRIAGSLKRVPLIEFRATGPEPSRGRGSGVRYAIQRGRGRAPNAFIATMRSGHRGVFQRKTTKRLAIQELFGPSVGRVLSRHQSEITSVGQHEFEKELDRLLNRIIQGGVGNAG